MQKYRNLCFLLTILVAGLFLRTFKIDTNYYFTGELGKEMLYIREFALSHTLPLVGMATSHSWLSYGPIYYWIMIPIFNIFNGNPYILFWTAAIVSLLGLILNYFVFKKIAGKRIALFSTMIQAVSPLLIWQTRLSKLHVFFWVIMPVFTYFLYLIWKGKKQWIFWAGLTFGLLFSFHFSQIPLFGVIVLLFWIKRKVHKFSDWIKFGVGVLIPNITLIWQDKNLALWLPYRVINLADKNPGGTYQSLLEYFGKNIFWDNRLWLVGLIVFAAIFAHYIFRNKKRFTKDFLTFYLISSISLMLIANILHGAPPIHYFLPIFTTVPILFAVYLEKFKFWPLILTPILFINLISFNKDQLFYSKTLKLDSVIDMVPYIKQEAAATFILTNSKGKPFSIQRVGPYDYFPEQYSQNYKYLILWKGGNLVDSSPNTYTIVEDLSKNTIYVQK